jgi:hypothetical protein
MTGSAALFPIDFDSLFCAIGWTLAGAALIIFLLIAAHFLFIRD